MDDREQMIGDYFIQKVSSVHEFIRRSRRSIDEDERGSLRLKEQNEGEKMQGICGEWQGMWPT